jgi:hypothetical protein
VPPGVERQAVRISGNPTAIKTQKRACFVFMDTPFGGFFTPAGDNLQQLVKIVKRPNF